MQQHHYAYQAQHSGDGTSSTFSSPANPDEDWTKISDLAERRRIQNRIAQRNYREKLKKRLEDHERRAGTSDDSSSPGTEKTSPVQKRELYDLDVDCEPEMDNETISGRCRDIRQQLTDLLTALENGSAQVSTTVTSSSIKDVLERFMLWAGNLGALRKPASKLSLDSRLAGSSDLRDYICTELEDMSEAIEDLINIVNGSTPNREIGYSSGSESDLDMESDESSDSDDPVDEAGSIVQVISQGITSLLKIGILVRQPASSGTDRFHRASRDSTNAFLDRFDIDYVRHKHPKLGAGDQSSRMGKAIAKRRQFIRYCRDHKSNLAAEENEGKDTSNPQIGSQKATTAKQSSKATTFVAKENLMDILQGSVDVLEEEEDAVSHCSVSTTSESLAILKLPRLADLSPDDDPFECPICYTLQQFRSEQAWRRHAYRDLKAYVCTVGGTECDDKFFDDRTSWFNHELEQHRSSYVCVLCGVNDGKNQRTRNVLRQHILSAHGNFESDQLERLEDAGRDTVTTFKANDCPFCDDWSELMARKMPPGKTAQPGDDFVVSTSRFKKHVAMHLEQLAIFALPRHEHETGMDEDGSHGSDSRVMDSRSSASLTGSFRSGDDRDIEDYQGDQPPRPVHVPLSPATSNPEDSWEDRLARVRSAMRRMDEEEMNDNDQPLDGGMSAADWATQQSRFKREDEEVDGSMNTATDMNQTMKEKHFVGLQTDNLQPVPPLAQEALRELEDSGRAPNVPSTQSSSQMNIDSAIEKSFEEHEERVSSVNISEKEEPSQSGPQCHLCDYRPRGDPRWFKGSMAKHMKVNHNHELKKLKAQVAALKPRSRSQEASYDLTSTIEQQQQELAHVGKSSNPPSEARPGSPSHEAPQSLRPDGQPAARHNSPKDMTTGEPAGTSNSGISVSPPLMSTKEEDRMRELEKHLARLEELGRQRFVVPSAVITEDDRQLVELAKQHEGKSFEYIASLHPRQRSADYWARRWHQITDVPRDNSDEERKDEDDSNTSDPSQEGLFKVEDNPFAFTPSQLTKLLNTKSLDAFYALGGLEELEKGLHTNRDSGLSAEGGDVRQSSSVKVSFVRSSETEKSPMTAPEKELDPEMEDLKQDREEFQLEEKRKEEEEKKLQADHNAETDRAIKQAQQTAEEKAAQGDDFWAKVKAKVERLNRESKKEEEEKYQRRLKEYQRRMKEDLINSGLDEKAIAAILKKEKIKKGKKNASGDGDRDSDGDKEDKNQGQTPARPTYTRMSLRHLNVDTLDHFKIDFEYDDDPGYVLIKRWVPEWEQKQLWDHTRQIRTAGTNIKEVSETLVIKDKAWGRPVRPLDEYDERYHHDNQSTRTKSRERTSNDKAYYGYNEEFDEHQPGPVEGHTRRLSSTGTSVIPSLYTRTFINPPAQQAALAAQQQRILQQRTMTAAGFHGQGNPTMTDQMTQAQPEEWIAAEQQMNAHQEQQQPHMMAPGTRDVAAQEGEEPPSTPGGRTRQRPESDKHPDKFHNEVSPEYLQSSTRRAKFRCPVSSCNREQGRKDNLFMHIVRVHWEIIVDDDAPASIFSTVDDGSYGKITESEWEMFKSRQRNKPHRRRGKMNAHLDHQPKPMKDEARSSDSH